MSRFPPLETEIGTLLDTVAPPALSSDFADRVVASAVQMPPPELPKLRKRPWRRRTAVAIAIGSLVSVAAAAAIAPEAFRTLPVIREIVDWISPAQHAEQFSANARPAIKGSPDAAALAEQSGAPLVPSRSELTDPDVPAQEATEAESRMINPVGTRQTAQRPTEPVRRPVVRETVGRVPASRAVSAPSVTRSNPEPDENVSIDPAANEEPPSRDVLVAGDGADTVPDAADGKDDQRESDLISPEEPAVTVQRTAVPTRSETPRVLREKRSASPVRRRPIKDRSRTRQTPRLPPPRR